MILKAARRTPDIIANPHYMPTNVDVRRLVTRCAYYHYLYLTSARTATKYVCKIHVDYVLVKAQRKMTGLTCVRNVRHQTDLCM